MQKFDVVIIGGGASGCMAALNIKNKSVAIIDSGKFLAKKIMATGNGRCNLTNMEVTSKYFNQNIDKYLNKFDNKSTIAYFESLGLEVFADEEGRIYPVSNSAKSVLDVINLALKDKVSAFLEQKVVDIKKDSKAFKIITDKEIFLANKVVVATGGNTMLNVIKKLGVDVKDFAPSLVALKCPEIKDLNGIKLSNVNVTVKTNDNIEKSEIGEVLFKDGGISGIVVFNLSTLFARNSNFNGEVKIDLFPSVTSEELFKKIEKRKALNVQLDKFFTGLFLPALANEIFKKSKINTNINSTKLSNDDINKLVKTIKNLTYKVNGCFDNNQVFSGGVKLECLDENLQSKIVPNIYFCGEICDVDGVCGGYNLQWAFTSGKIVGDCL